MRTLLALTLGAILSGCATAPVSHLEFKAVEARDVDKGPAHSRNVFTSADRPIFITTGRECSEGFVEITRNGRHYDTSPPRPIKASGSWFGISPLPFGSYRATLYLNGLPAATVDFAVIP